jgi:hypothetical protein
MRMPYLQTCACMHVLVHCVHIQSGLKARHIGPGALRHMQWHAATVTQKEHMRQRDTTAQTEPTALVQSRCKHLLGRLAGLTIICSHRVAGLTACQCRDRQHCIAAVHRLSLAHAAVGLAREAGLLNSLSAKPQHRLSAAWKLLCSCTANNASQHANHANTAPHYSMAQPGYANSNAACNTYTQCAAQPSHA